MPDGKDSGNFERQEKEVGRKLRKLTETLDETDVELADAACTKNDQELNELDGRVDDLSERIHRLLGGEPNEVEAPRSPPFDTQTTAPRKQKKEKR